MNKVNTVKRLSTANFRKEFKSFKETPFSVFSGDARNMLKYLDEKFNGNENYKKIVNSSAFCSEKNNIVSDNYKITNNEKIGIIPPIGGG